MGMGCGSETSQVLFGAELTQGNNFSAQKRLEPIIFMPITREIINCLIFENFPIVVHGHGFFSMILNFLFLALLGFGF